MTNITIPTNTKFIKAGLHYVDGLADGAVIEVTLEGGHRCEPLLVSEPEAMQLYRQLKQDSRYDVRPSLAQGGLWMGRKL